MNVHVLGPKDWRKQTADLEPEILSFLRTCHDRHIPITPGLAEDFVAEFAADGRRRHGRGKNRWTPLINRCAAALETPRPRRRLRPDVAFDAAAAPILRTAAKQVGASALFGDAGFGPGLGQSLTSYQEELESAVGELLTNPDGMGSDFWRYAAVVLFYGGTQRRRAARARPSRNSRLVLPVEPEPRLVTLIAGIDPVFDRQSLRPLRQVPQSRTSWRRSGFRPKEDGVEGIRPTGNTEDLTDALVSEFAKPPLALLVSLSEGSVLVKTRPPSILPKRDLLFVCISPGMPVHDSEMIVRAAFVDAALRLWPLLTASGRTRIDLAYASAAPAGCHSFAMRLDHVRREKVANPLAVTGKNRLHLLRMSNLLPDAVELLPLRFSRDPSGKPPPSDLIGTALHAVGDVPMDNPETSAHTQDAQSMAVEDVFNYETVLAVEVLPYEPTGDAGAASIPWTEERAKLRFQLTLGPHPDARLARVRCPIRIAEGGPFLIDGIAKTDQQSAIAASEGADLGESLAKLIGAISLEFVEMGIEALNAR